MNDLYKDVDGTPPSTGCTPRRTTSPASWSPAPRRPSSPAATSRRCSQADPGRRADGLRDGRGDQGRPAPARDLRQAGRGRDQRRRARRRPRDHAWPATTGSWSTTPRSSSACPRPPSACCPAAAASPASSGCSASSPALMDVLLQGTRFKPAAGQGEGPRRRAGRRPATSWCPAAKAWIIGQPRRRRGRDEPVGPRRLQDARRHARAAPTLAAFLPAFPAMLRKQTKGAVYPAPRAIMSAAIEGAQVDFDTASPDRVALPGQADRRPEQQEHDPGVLLRPAGDQLRARCVPRASPPFTATKVGVLGAGMMGAGIAYSCARAGMEVVLKDVAQEAAEKGKAYSEKLLDKADRARQARPRRRRPSCSTGSPPTADAGRPRRLRPRHRGGLRGPVAQAQGVRRDRGRTSTPTRCCAPTPRRCRSPSSPTGVDRPGGLHRPALLLARSTRCRWSRSSAASRPPTRRWPRRYDVVQQIRKTPIVVNDSRGFYTSRVIGTMVNEGLAMLGEGVHPMSLERAATQAGYPVGTAAALRRAEHGADGQDRARPPRTPPSATAATYAPHPAEAVVDDDDRARPPVAAQGRRLLRLRRERQRAAACGRAWPSRSRSPTSSRRSRTSRTGCCSSRRSRPRSASRRASSSPPPRPTSARSWASASRR